MDKQFILDEIRRTAVENGAKVLGARRFLKETGIKASDWDKHWDRWGDAVREAGLKPNSKNVAIREQILFEKLISLIRELGHFPVKNELRRRARVDRDFPSANVFQRFAGGLGQKLACKVGAFCEVNSGYGDVLGLCSSISSSPNFKTAKSAVEEQNFGSVYLLKSGRHYKIGRSNAAGRREYEIAIQLPQKSNLLHRIRTDDPVGIEEYWHKRFADKRKNGEWFELSSSDVKDFTRRKFM